MLSVEIHFLRMLSEIVDQYVLKLDNFEKKTFWIFRQAVFTECFEGKW